MPDVVSFSFNATLGTAPGAKTPGPGGFLESAAFPLFAAGERRAQAPWLGAAAGLPPAMREAYAVEQLQLLCIAQVRQPCTNSGSVMGTKTFGMHAAAATCDAQGVCAGWRQETLLFRSKRLLSRVRAVRIFFESAE